MEKHYYAYKIVFYKLYEKHLYSKYGYCYVVFDCYRNGPSAKDMQIEVAQACPTLPSYQMKNVYNHKTIFWVTKTTKPVLLLG